MSKEEQVKESLIEKFSYLKDSIIIPRERRIFIDLPQDKFFEVFDYLINSLSFERMPAITGMDEGSTFAVVYHLSREGNLILSLKIHISREGPVIKTITKYFPGADIYERELKDLLGIQVEGLPIANRYPLPDNWPEGEYPLRKDYRKSTEDTDVKP